MTNLGHPPLLSVSYSGCWNEVLALRAENVATVWGLFPVHLQGTN